MVLAVQLVPTGSLAEIAGGASQSVSETQVAQQPDSDSQPADCSADSKYGSDNVEGTDAPSADASKSADSDQPDDADKSVNPDAGMSSDSNASVAFTSGTSTPSSDTTEPAATPSVTTDTYASNGGAYTLDHILRTYGVFVSGDFSGAHVEGPAICGGTFDATLGGASDGAHAVPSYLGLAGQALGDTLSPCSGVAEYLGTANIGKAYLVRTDAEGTTSASPIRYTDSYVDASQWEGALKSQAANLAASCSTTVTVADDGSWASSDPTACSTADGTLYVRSGAAVRVDADILGSASKIVVCADPTDPGDGTVVPLEDDTLVACDGASVADLPVVSFVGHTDGAGQGGSGLGLVFCLPNATTVRASRKVVGHLVAPRAGVTLVASRVDGCVVAASVAGSATVTLHPYGGRRLSGATGLGDKLGVTSTGAKKGPSLMAMRSMAATGIRRQAVESTGSDASQYFHATVSFNASSYASGSTAACTVKYVIDRGMIHEGDYVTVSIPKEVASSVKFSVSPQHFSNAVDNGDGTWTLVFGSGAEAALTGSFSAFIKTTTVTQDTTEPVKVGNASRDLTVYAPDTSASSGTHVADKRAIDKSVVAFYDASGSSAVSSSLDSSSDTSEGNGGAASYTYDSEQSVTVRYQLTVNPKNTVMENPVVVDTLPDGMDFSTVSYLTPKVHYYDPSTYQQEDVPSDKYTITQQGNKLTFSYEGTLDRKQIYVEYYATAPAGKTAKYTNHADISYTEDGTSKQESTSCVVHGASYDAASGEKSVDKTTISTDASDQLVTYTIKFWNQGGFQAGAINLDDNLNQYLQYEGAIDNDCFEVTYNQSTNTVHITNKRAIPASSTEYVSFVTDFSKVPAGTTVYNTVGGNTTKTVKAATSTQLMATKTMNGCTPSADQTFTFQLLDSTGKVLQQKQNSGSDVIFDPLYYYSDDMPSDGSDVTVSYQIKEVAPSGDTNGDGSVTADGITYDTATYKVAVTLHQDTDANGVKTMTATPVITKNGSSVDSITFANKTVSTTFTLPETGGSGLQVGETVGLATLLASAAALLRRRRTMPAAGSKGGDCHE